VTLALTIVVFAQTLVLSGTVWILLKVLRVLLEVLAEARESAAERQRRKEAEASGAIYDAVEVREARFILATLDTDPNCFPCRDAVEKGRQRLRDRLRVTPRARV
jgi:hypothetical protein